jgi:polar amino acid transport system substrate-binding protein
MIRRTAALGLLLLAWSVAARSAPSERNPLAGRVWRVGVFESPPYAMRDASGEWRGLTIDLWKELASELSLEYRFGEATPDAIVDDLAHGRLDAAAGPFSVTVDREKTIDFSHAFLIQEEGIAVRKGGDEERWLSVARALSTPTAWRIYFGLIAAVIVSGVAVWLLERRRNPEFSGSLAQGLGSGVWWSGVTTVSVGYGDKVPITFWGRAIALLWMFLSLILITAFTAFVTTKLAVAELGRVQGPESLRNSIVGTVDGAAVGEFLRRQRIPHRLYASIPKALDGLRAKEIAAVLYSAPILDYYIQRDARDDVEILPTTYVHELLAFPLSDDSPLRDPLNGALRRFLQQPAWRDLQDRYLASARAAGHTDQ